MFLNRAFGGLTEPLVEMVDKPEEADYVLLPHNYPSLKAQSAYIHRQSDLARSFGKKIIMFWHGDSDAPIADQHAIVFRTNQYRSSLQKNEIMMPAYAEDLLEGDLSPRSKHPGKPIVGFCGWAGYKNFKNAIGTIVKNSIIEASGIVGIHREARVKGITYRMKVIKHLKQSTMIEPNFIIRNSYSGHTSTIKTDPELARREYIDNLLGSDYALIIKGDGNYSYRFYEALSLGRIPVLLDTECVLPLEDKINYDEFIVRVPYGDLYHLDRIVADHYENISDQQFIDMQKRGREVFEKYLKVDSFLKYATENLLP
ncbi:MAG: exostosin family protein [Candidatus Peribacteraceae bacterium]|nr:exostosin family protein [Candidatus Peribacteraceae bacterium]